MTRGATAGVASTKADQDPTDEQTNRSARAHVKLGQKLYRFRGQKVHGNKTSQANPDRKRQRPQALAFVEVAKVGQLAFRQTHRADLLEAGRNSKALSCGKIQQRYGQSDQDSRKPPRPRLHNEVHDC